MLNRSTLTLVLIAITLGALGGCGDSRTAPPSFARFLTPTGVTSASFLSGSLRLQAPANWATQIGVPPLVVTYASGPAVIAIWRYPREESQALPHDAAALGRARSALIRAAGARDPTLRVISSAVIEHGGVYGVELDALETVRGHVRRVRSAHVYQRGAELVIDEYAPASQFHAVDRAVFSPLLHSVHLGRMGSA